nr:hypothetical protein HK105_001078 [Polyrhizophydium stewartii]
MEAMMMELERMDERRQRLELVSRTLTQSLSALERPRRTLETLRQMSRGCTSDTDPPALDCAIEPVVRAGKACVRVIVTASTSIDFCIDERGAKLHVGKLTRHTMSLPMPASLSAMPPWYDAPMVGDFGSMMADTCSRSFVVELPFDVFPQHVGVSLGYADASSYHAVLDDAFPDDACGDDAELASLAKAFMLSMHLRDETVQLFSFALPPSQAPEMHVSASGAGRGRMTRSQLNEAIRSVSGGGWRP